MSQLDTIAVPPGVWTELTNANVSAIRIQNIGNHPVQIMATTGTSEPSNSVGAMTFGRDDILAANIDLADLFPSVTAGYRVWATAENSTAVSISHA